jgi:hypothetical protein
MSFEGMRLKEFRRGAASAVPLEFDSYQGTASAVPVKSDKEYGFSR